MVIAYFIQLNTEVNSGVHKKINAQVKNWISLGHEVRIFIVTKNPDFANLDELSSITHVFKFTPRSIPAPLDGRMSAMTRAIQSISKFRPDIIYTRQDIFLPPIISLLLRFKTVLEINTIDMNELKGTNPIFLSYYRLTRGILLSLCKGHIYVSREIMQSNFYSHYTAKKLVIGNGINTDSPVHSTSNRDLNHAIFIGTAGQKWHGIDKIIYLAQKMPTWRFSIIGVSAADLPSPPTSNVDIYGHLDTEAYRSIISSASVGIGTLALHRKNMTEASPLKVREYLSYGLPIIIGYTDTDLSPSEYILELPNEEGNVAENVNKIASFMERVKGMRIQRETIIHLTNEYKERQRINFFQEVK